MEKGHVIKESKKKNITLKKIKKTQIEIKKR
jgi:hypothetical protein